jgi:hypothetical protein
MRFLILTPTSIKLAKKCLLCNIFIPGLGTFINARQGVFVRSWMTRVAVF